MAKEVDLKIEETEDCFLQETLGWEWEKCLDFMRKFEAFTKIVDERKITTVLEKFLNSPYFKKLKLPLREPKHWIALGWSACISANYLYLRDSRGIEGVVEKMDDFLDSKKKEREKN